MPVRKMVSAPETFDVLIWDGSNDAEVEAFDNDPGGGVYFRLKLADIADPDGSSQKYVIVFNLNRALALFPIRPGDAIIRRGRDGFEVTRFNPYVPYEDVYVTA